MARARNKDLPLIKRILRNLPDAFDTELAEVLRRAGPRLQAAMRARAPSRTGALKAGIAWRVNAKSLRLRVGLLGTAKGRASLFYGRIQDLGRRAQTVWVTRRVVPRAISPMLRGKYDPSRRTSYQLRVGGMPGKKFVTGQMTTLRTEIRGELNTTYERALRAITGARS